MGRAQNYWLTDDCCDKSLRAEGNYTPEGIKNFNKDNDLALTYASEYRLKLLPVREC